MKKRTVKQNIALIGVILIVIMILATLITAFADPTGRYFRSCLIVTIALPIALWVFMWAYGAMMHKHTPASFDLGGADKPSAADGMESAGTDTETDE
ncbi:MAG: hypothetical protein IJS12_03535 [Lachnospiraceae bacterium]|nr:hypothetical protein [Lachnospiraceae bacterium]